MKFMIYILAVLLASNMLTANDNIRIKANRCLSIAQNPDVTESEMQKSLNELKALCKTKDEQQYYEEIKILSEIKYNTRPLITAVTTFTCEDLALAMAVKPSAIAEILESSLDESFTKVTRKDIDKAIEELNFQNSDLFDKSTSVKLGSFVGAQYIICGNIQKVADEIVITARLIEVKTGMILKNGIIKPKSTGEITDAIPNLASQLSIRNKQDKSATLSSYAIKYLNSANKKIFAEKFNAASEDIMHSNMFLSDKKIKNSLINLQSAITSQTCFLSQRNYKASAAEMNKSIDMARELFGETDDVVIHSHYALAQSYLKHGDTDKAMSAFQDARKLFERTKEAKNGKAIPFAALEETIKRRMRKEKYQFDKYGMERSNNNFIYGKFNVSDIPTYTAAAARTSAPVAEAAEKISSPRRLDQKFRRQNSAVKKVTRFNSGRMRPAASKTNSADNILQQELKKADAFIRADNYSEAIKILEKFSASLPPVYTRKLAVCYEKSGSSQKALACYIAAGNKKDLFSLLWLGRYYAKAGSADDAVKYYIAAADQGYHRANLSAALLYLNRRSGIYDEGKGIEYMKKAAEAGVPAAQYNLGCCYARFSGTRFASIPYNREEAIKWLKKAQENGIKTAAKALARLK